MDVCRVNTTISVKVPSAGSRQMVGVSFRPSKKGTFFDGFFCWFFPDKQKHTLPPVQPQLQLQQQDGS